MDFLQEYLYQIIATCILILISIILRIASRRAVRRYSKASHLLEHRSTLVLKYISFFITMISMIAIFILWGVRPKDIILTVSSLFTIIGVAMIAEWSILSNVTAGIILLLSFPFKIGDTIRIHDKDFPIEAEIDDIRAFHTLFRTKEGELISYPNILLLKKGVTIIKYDVLESKDFTD